ncbi:MAG: hypothetical protein Q7S18_00350 [bacterium]|nr:hypothetical protein [bacterium]
MNKKTLTVIVVVILTITAVAFWKILEPKNKQANNIEDNVTSGLQESSDTASGNISNPSDSNDVDIKSIESDLNSIDDSDFSEDKLSDQNIGL